MDEFESKLLPVLREGVDVVKMTFFHRLMNHLDAQHPGREAAFIKMLAALVVNDIFCTPNPTESFVFFLSDNRSLIHKTLKEVPLEFADMMVPLTDALRIQVLCDKQEGIDSLSILAHANELKILLVPMQIPLPASFMQMVRELGSKHDILLPASIRKLDS